MNYKQQYLDLLVSIIDIVSEHQKEVQKMLDEEKARLQSNQ